MFWPRKTGHVTRLREAIILETGAPPTTLNDTQWDNAALTLAHRLRRCHKQNRFNVYPLNTGHSHTAVSMLGQRRRRWTNIETALGECRVCWVVFPRLLQRLLCPTHTCSLVCLQRRRHMSKNPFEYSARTRMSCFRRLTQCWPRSTIKCREIQKAVTADFSSKQLHPFSSVEHIVPMTSRNSIITSNRPVIQQTRDVLLIVVQCWNSFADGGTAIKLLKPSWCLKASFYIFKTDLIFLQPRVLKRKLP